MPVKDADAPTEEVEDLRTETLRAVVEQQGLVPIASNGVASPEMVELGRALFFDPELSGNRDQACSTCHHPDHALTDGRSLSVGTAAVERDGVRMPGPDHTFVPRNSPGLFNLDAAGLQNLMWDGRVEEVSDGHFVLHDVGYDALGVYRELPDGLDGLLAAQVMLPVMVRDELRGEVGEEDIYGEVNELALIADRDFESIWAGVMARLVAIDEYAAMLSSAYPDVDTETLTYVHAANGIAAFLSDAFTLADSPWDRFLAGDDTALDSAAIDGALLFYGEARCSTCHMGSLMTDQRFHNLGVRPMSGGPSDYEYIDYGAAHRSHVGDEARFAFRTPPLRNVVHSGPWMHNGCYGDLETVVRHHLEPIESLYGYDASQLDPEFQNQVHDSPDVLAEVEASISEDLLELPSLTDEQVEMLLAFLNALSSPAVLDLSLDVPESVPSGLPLVDP